MCFGIIQAGIADVKNHACFARVKWDEMYQRQVAAPWTPALQNELDMSHFDEYDPSEEAPSINFSGTNTPFDGF
jgi:hypothetical protein